MRNGSLFYIFTAWAAITINFFIPRLIPGDPVAVLIAEYQGQMAPRPIHSLYVLFGLDKQQSLWQQYIDYWASCCTATSGISFTFFPSPVPRCSPPACRGRSRWSASPRCSAS